MRFRKKNTNLLSAHTLCILPHLVLTICQISWNHFTVEVNKAGIPIFISYLKGPRGTSLAVQWLRLCTSTAAGARVPSLVRKLRSHMPPCGQKKNKTKNRGWGSVILKDIPKVTQLQIGKVGLGFGSRAICVQGPWSLVCSTLPLYQPVRVLSVSTLNPHTQLWAPITNPWAEL